MDYKCSRCQLSLPSSEFNKKTNRPNGLSAYCRSCNKAYLKSHYSKNTDYYLDKAKARNEKELLQYRKLKENPCTDCKIAYPYYVMEWDHLPDYIKKGHPANLRKHRGIKAFLEEIKKCELVCANCHKERSYKRRCGE